MDKEQLRDTITEGIMIAKIKEEIFRIIQDFKSDTYLCKSKIVEEINDISIEEFRYLSYSSHSESRYNERMMRIINKVLDSL